MIFRLNWQLALAVVITVPLLSLGMRWLMDEARRTFQQGKSAGGVVTAYLHDILLGIDAAKAFNAHEYEIKRFQERQSDLLVRLRRWAVRGSLMEPLMVATAAITVVVVLVYGNWLVSAGTLDAASYIAFLFYVALLIPQARGISMLLLGWQQFCNGIRRLDEILSIPVETDLPGSEPLRTPVAGRIEFSHVTHSYPDRARALNDVSFAIEPMEHVGVVGASGAGKTTLFNLILRFYQPTSGAISVDGVDVTKVTASSLRDAIALVPQDIILFDDTILNNVRYGRWGATDSEVHSACRAAQAEDFILELPHRHLTNVGERGIQLSGGQRQRLAIARALLKNAPILLLDEATSSLDTQTERQLQEAMEFAMRGRTTIIVAHRLATVVHLPRLIVLEHGRVLDEGSHEDLLRRCERYRNLVATQLIGFPEPHLESYSRVAP
jgi:subfamily B ATP-binding cassette protein MsbA